MNTDNELKKAWLMRYLYAKRRKNEADDELDQLCAVGSRAITYSDMPKGSPDLNGLETIAIAADRKLEELRAATAECQKTRDEVRRAINKLPETESVIMFYRYTCYQQTDYERKHKREGTRQLTWQEIANKTNYSIHNVWRIHGAALAHLQIPKDYKAR